MERLPCSYKKMCILKRMCNTIYGHYLCSAISFLIIILTNKNPSFLVFIKECHRIILVKQIRMLPLLSGTISYMQSNNICS